MSKILFHPNITAAQAMEIAEGQGGKAVWSRGRVVLAQQHVDQAINAVNEEKYCTALNHLRAARHAIFDEEDAPCVA